MSKHKKLWLFLITLLIGKCLHAQQEINDNRRSLTVKPDTCILFLDSSFVLASSVAIESSDNPDEKVKFKMINARPLFIEFEECEKWKYQNLIISYRVIDMPYISTFSFIDSTATMQPPGETYIAYDLRKNEFFRNNEQLFSNGLDYSGSFTRGFSLGNAQSLTLDSRFDLQLQGEIGNGINIRAAISDDNIPIQPEGNTQVLQEFDRIYMSLQKNKTQVQAGDYVLQRPNSWFVNYFKKIKGLGVRTSQDLGNSSHQSEVNIASSRGKFARQTLAVREGNQGPYKLTGNNNERFLILLSGTEKIFFNGELLVRGQDQDYVIDYNLAEVTFSPRRLVATESRIIVEYEYTDQNYYRTLYTANSEWNINNASLRFFFYSEQDSKKSTSQISLDSLSIETLKNGGDNAERYNVSQLIPVSAGDVSSVTYQLKQNPDFPSDPNAFILEYSTDKNQLLYTSAFTEVGAGKGSYTIDSEVGANGRVYKYVGYGKGNYEPVKKLVPPEKKQMIGIASSVPLGKRQYAGLELSMSQLDKNLFSPVDDGDNVGWAGLLTYSGSSTFNTPNDSLGFKYEISHEHTASTFRALNQYRQAEFYRDWNYTPLSAQREDILRAALTLQKSKGSYFTLGFQSIHTGAGFAGSQYRSDFNLKYKRLQIIGRPSFTQTSEMLASSRFLRPNFRIVQGLPFVKNLNIGVDVESENNRIDSLVTGKISPASFQFNHVKSFLEWNASPGFAAKFSYNKRTDKAAGNFDLEKITDITEYESSLLWTSFKFTSLNISMKVRDFKALNPILRPQEQSKLSTLGNIEAGFKLLRNVILMTSNYQVSSGQEPKLEFVYQKVENLRGDYVYVGPDTAKVKNIHDFRYDPENPLAAYTRFVVPNNEFTSTNNTAIQNNLRIEPSRWWGQSGIPKQTWKKLVSRISLISTLKIQGKTLSSVQQYSPFSFSTSDSMLVNYQNNSVTAINFNKGNPKYDLSFTRRNQDTKNNQVNGFEARTYDDTEWRGRLNAFRNTDLILLFTSGTKKFENRLFNNRNFDIDFRNIESQISYRPTTLLRVSGKFKHARLQQTINQMESATNNEFNIDVSYRRSGNTSMDASLSYVKIRYNGTAGSLIEYDLLEGLKNGQNYLWSFSLTRRISKVIDLIFSYEGRKTGINNTLHVARMQAKASF